MAKSEKSSASSKGSGKSAEPAPAPAAAANGSAVQPHTASDAAPSDGQPTASLDLSHDSDGSSTGSFVSTGPAGTASASLTRAPTQPSDPGLSDAELHKLAQGLKDDDDTSSDTPSDGSGKMTDSTDDTGKTDAAAAAATVNLASVPAMAMGTLTQTMAHSTGLLYQNAVAQQQQTAMAAQAATMQGVLQIYSLDTSAAAAAVTKLAQVGALDKTLSGILGKQAGGASGG